MRDAIIEAKPDVVHSNWTYEASLAAIDSTLPHVATIRDAPFTVLRYHRDLSRPVPDCLNPPKGTVMSSAS